MGAAARRDRGGLPLLEQRARPGLPRRRGHPRRPRDRGDGAGHGVRQPRRPLRHRRPVHPEPVDRRADALRRRDVRAQGEDVVAGTHRPSRSRVLDERRPRPRGDLWRDADVLEHHYADMCDIEFTIEDGPSGCCRSAPASAARTRPCAWPSRWPRTRTSRSTRERPCSGCCGYLAHPPTISTGRPGDAAPAHPRARAPPRGWRPERSSLTPAAAELAADGHRVHPRARRDVARGRARHGPGRRRAHLPRWTRQPRRRRGPRLGHPGRRRAAEVQHRGPRRSSPAIRSRAAASRSRSTDTGEVFAGEVAGSRWSRRRPRPCSRGPPSSASRCRRRRGIRATTSPRPPTATCPRTTCWLAVHQDDLRRRRRPADCLLTTPEALAPVVDGARGRASWPRRRRPARSPRPGPPGRPARSRPSGSAGAPAGRRRPGRLRPARPADEDDRHGLADAGRRRRAGVQRPHRRRSTTRTCCRSWPSCTRTRRPGWSRSAPRSAGSPPTAAGSSAR